MFHDFALCSFTPMNFHFRFNFSPNSAVHTCLATATLKAYTHCAGAFAAVVWCSLDFTVDVVSWPLRVINHTQQLKFHFLFISLSLSLSVCVCSSVYTTLLLWTLYAQAVSLRARQVWRRCWCGAIDRPADVCSLHMHLQCSNLSCVWCAVPSIQI